MLDDLFYKRSVLREVATDLPEIKEAKAQVRLLLNDHIRSYQKADPRFSELKQSAYKGNTNTAKYQKAYTAFIDDTLFEAKKLAGPLEKAFALIYQLGQNGKVIVDPTKDPSASAGADSSGQGSPKTPTQTTQPEKKDMSIEEWRLHMAREIAAGN